MRLILHRADVIGSKREEDNVPSIDTDTASETIRRQGINVISTYGAVDDTDDVPDMADFEDSTNVVMADAVCLSCDVC